MCGQVWSVPLSACVRGWLCVGRVVVRPPAALHQSQRWLQLTSSNDGSEAAVRGADGSGEAVHRSPSASILAESPMLSSPSTSSSSRTSAAARIHAGRSPLAPYTPLATRRGHLKASLSPIDRPSKGRPDDDLATLPGVCLRRQVRQTQTRRE